MSSINTLYKLVIDDVIKNIKPEFESEEIDLSVLNFLQKTWEERVNQSGVLMSPHETYDAPSHLWDGNYRTPYNNNRNIPPINNISNIHNIKTGMPYTTNLNILNNPNINLHNIHTINNNNNTNTNTNTNNNNNSTNAYYKVKNESQHIPQGDGDYFCETNIENTEENNDNDEEIKQNNDGVKQMIEFEIGDVKVIDQSNIPQLDGKNEEPLYDDTDELGSDLDAEDEKEPETANIVLCQFEKVNRIKNKFKCVLKDGIMNLQGKDYHFSRATGEFDF